MTASIVKGLFVIKVSITKEIETNENPRKTNENP